MEYRDKGLRYPLGYWKMSEEDRKKASNGCGAAGWKVDVVPDTIWGLDISKACDIHDVAYHIGRTISDKNSGDFDFHYNLKELIRRNSNWFTRKLRNARAYWYYKVVAEFGESAFLVGKDGINV